MTETQNKLVELEFEISLFDRLQKSLTTFSGGARLIPKEESEYKGQLIKKCLDLFKERTQEIKQELDKTGGK